MKCTVCGEPARINAPRHNSKFCERHFLRFVFRQVWRTIEEYRMFTHRDTLLLGVSGGKDSMTAWNILAEQGYTVHAVHIDMGFGDYSRRSEEIVRTFAAARDLALSVQTFEELMGFTFQHALQIHRRRACALCGTVRRYFLNRLARDLGCTVVVTGHNLDDETATLLGNVLHWQMGYLERQYPVLEAEAGLLRKVKPLVKLTDEETGWYVKLRNIDTVSGTCPYSRGATSPVYKDIMGEIEKRMIGIKADFYFNYLNRMREQLSSGGSSRADKNYFCPECGYRTLKGELCFVCSLKRPAARGSDGSSLPAD